MECLLLTECIHCFPEVTRYFPIWRQLMEGTRCFSEAIRCFLILSNVSWSLPNPLSILYFQSFVTQQPIPLCTFLSICEQALQETTPVSVVTVIFASLIYFSIAACSLVLSRLALLKERDSERIRERGNRRERERQTERQRQRDRERERGREES